VKNIILTKINLAKKGWKGSVLCEFYGGREDMNHLFFECPMAKYNWSVASCALGIGTKPENFYDLCQNWLQKFTGHDRTVVMLYISFAVEFMDDKKCILFSTEIP
jgi:hypothetical protein